jgi:hypothetical protein
MRILEKLRKSGAPLPEGSQEIPDVVGFEEESGEVDPSGQVAATGKLTKGLKKPKKMS